MNFPRSGLVSGFIRRGFLPFALGVSCLSTRAQSEKNLLANGDFARDLSGWKVVATPGIFTPKAGTPGPMFGQADPANTNDPYIAQEFPYKKAYFHVKLRYKTDGILAPTILICAPNADVRPLGILRLSPATEWKTFEADMLGFDVKKPPVEFRIYPGTLDEPRLKEDGLTPLAQHAGTAEFADVQIEVLPRAVGTLSKGPVPVKIAERIFKTVGELSLKIKIDQPEGITKPRPAIIWFHGGGWTGGNPDSCLLQTTYFATRGIPCVRPQYRLVSEGGNIETTMEDVMDAVKWVRENGKDYGIDPNRIIIAGTSAGAHLGGLAAQKTPECVGFIGVAGIYDMVKKGDSSAGRNPDFLKGGNDPAIWKQASAIYQLRHPPVDVFLVHGGMDTTLDPSQSLRFAEAVRAAGGQAEVIIIPELIHFPNLIQEDIFQRMEKFVREKSR